MMKSFVIFLILLAIGLTTFSVWHFSVFERLGLAEKKELQSEEDFFLVIKSDEYWKEAIEPQVSTLAKALHDANLLASDGTVDLAKIKAQVDGDLPFGNMLKERGFVKDGSINLESLNAELLPKETPLAIALKGNGFVDENGLASLILFKIYLRKQDDLKSEKSGKLKYPFGIQYRGGQLKGIPSVIEKFDIWNHKDLARANALMNTYLKPEKPGSVVGLTRLLLESKDEKGNSLLAASNNTLCMPIGFEIEVSLPTGYYTFYPKAKIYPISLMDEISLPNVILFLKRDAGFTGDIRGLKNEIVKRNPRMIGSNLLKPGKIIVNPMKRDWYPEELKFFGSEEKGEGILFWLTDHASLAERLPLFKRFVKDFPQDLTPEKFKEELMRHKELINEYGELEYDIGVHISTSGSGYHNLFRVDKQSEYLPRRPVGGGEYELDIHHDFHLLGALNFLKVDAVVSSTFGFRNLEQEIVSRYPKMMPGEVRYSFTVRVTPGKNGKLGSYKILSYGDGDAHILLTNQREEDGIIRGTVEDPIQLTEAARLLRAFGGAPSHIDGFAVMKEILRKPHYRYPSGKMRPVTFWINPKTGAHGFDLMEEEQPSGTDQKDLETEEVKKTDEDSSLRIYRIGSDDPDTDFKLFAVREGIDDPAAFAAELKEIGIRPPFEISVDPEAKDPADKFSAGNLDK